MSQTSLLDLDPSQDMVTQGVKVTSYFGIHIRPQFPGATNQLWELYSLARALDTLRMGDIGSASDQLAGRFIAIHQSLVDGGWATAKYMELTPLEDASAATPSLVLATRRHSKVCLKVVGRDGYGGGCGSDHGKGKQSWSYWERENEKSDANNKGKGKNNKRKGQQLGEGRGETPKQMGTANAEFIQGVEFQSASTTKATARSWVDNPSSFISRAASLDKSVLETPSSDWQTPECNWVRTALEGSQILDELGMALSWSVVHAIDSGDTGFSQSIIDIFADATKPGRYPLPLPLGNLAEFVEFLRKSSCLECRSSDIVAGKAEDGWLFLIIFGVNALHSSARLPERGPWLAKHKRAVETLRGRVRRFRKGASEVAREVNVEEIEKELKAKRVNYSGEELLLYHPLILRQILPSLPPVEHGGCVRALDWVGEVTTRFLERPDLMVVEDAGQELPKLQGKINIVAEDLDAVVNELCRRNVCMWVPLSEVLHFRGQPVLNGMFGVEKPSKLEDNSPVLRVIMNFVPSNLIHRQLTGGTSSLPYITQWLSTVLEDQQEVRIWQSDMSSVFYLFALPKAWWGHLSFNILRYGHQIGLPSNQVFLFQWGSIPRCR